MKAFFQILILLCLLQKFQAQDNSGYRIMRSSVGSSGSSQNIVTTKGTYNISQSIGQTSVIGTHSSNGYVLRQGYQQPSNELKAVEELDYHLDAKVHPNPFKQTITITFSQSMLNTISATLFDIHGKIIYNEKFLPAQSVVLKLNDIAIGNYILNVVCDKKRFNTKLIKI